MFNVHIVKLGFCKTFFNIFVQNPNWNFTLVIVFHYYTSSKPYFIFFQSFKPTFFFASAVIFIAVNVCFFAVTRAVQVWIAGVLWQREVELFCFCPAAEAVL